VNSRERTVLVVLAVVLAGGAGLTLVRRTGARGRPRLEVLGNRADSAETAMFPLDLNAASARQLEALPGIGPVLAQRIVDYREGRGGFRSTAELRSVSGIGPKRMAAIERLVTVRPAAGP